MTIKINKKWKTVETDTHVFFLSGPFSQWHASTFQRSLEPDGPLVTFNRAEQWMMASKAMLFGDLDALEQIMASNDPSRQKELGKRVKPFEQAKWDARAFEIVVGGNISKFYQNPPLRDYLIATDSKILVEGNKHDTVWAVGLSWDDPLIFDPANWRGKNLLGQALMQVRDFFTEADEAVT